MPPHFFSSRYRKQVFGVPNDIQYKNCSNRPNNYTDIKCTGCVDKAGPILSSPHILQTVNKRIYNISRIPTSEFIMNKSAFTVYTGSQINGKTWNQSSDRALAHMTPNPVPSHGNSITATVTSLRPGAMRPGGKGIDIKHNSYARYLNRRKAQSMLAGPYIGNLVPEKAVVNNKVQKQNSINCIC
jgi:hypothetical protein